MSVTTTVEGLERHPVSLRHSRELRDDLAAIAPSKGPMVVAPLTLFIILILLYLNTRSLAKTALVLLAEPFSLVGAVWTAYLLGYNMNLAVWVGMIALAGLDAETGVITLLYLDQAWERLRGAAGRSPAPTRARPSIRARCGACGPRS